ncbi:DUF2938 domain-containing protein [Leptospira ognonensis]|uniref:DUF2938 domain-containing protein n=1 Tax=Leptospira ognonensis TaxID=2484945 RepID=A0A4R9JU83_9LEPT|nr:DUF2938 domain-containing protein [Leptospira ognonensis]TGL55855.1 DUF2938 domain-containing protein [Leptospira ognonensis]
MDHSLVFYLRVALLGIGATLLMDFWRYLLFKSMGVISLDLGLLGRWVGHMFRGRLVHQSISKSQAIPGETLLGWVSHYAIGITFAFLLPIIWGEEWLHEPTFLPALIVGLGTVFAPWLLMQPAMGVGVAASKAPKPSQVRVRNIAIHTVYGLGLFASALLLKELYFMGNK